jgi:hypothetical protein
MVLGILASPARLTIRNALVGLRLRGSATGRTITLPIQYAWHTDAIIAVPGDPTTKLWWRNLRGGGDIDVLLDGRWLRGRGTVLRRQDSSYAPARDAYHRRWPRVPLSPDNPIIRIDLDNGAPNDH